MMVSRTITLTACSLFFMLALLMMAPASVTGRILEKNISGFSYGDVTGRLWQGRFYNVSYKNISLGRADYNLNLLPLITGKAEFDVTFAQGALTGNTRIAMGGKSFMASGGRLRAQLQSFTANTALGVPISGVADIEITTINIDENGCQQADFSLWTDFLMAPARQFGGQGFPVEGRGQCVGENLSLALMGAGEEGIVDLSFLIRPDLRYSFKASASPTRGEVAEALAFLGFERDGEQFNYGVDGILQVNGS